MRRIRRPLAVALVLGAAVVAHAIGNGDIKAVTPVTVVTITSTTGGGNGNATLQNTTTATSYNVLIGSDATCDPALSFSIVGGNPITSFSPQTTRNVSVTCPARGSDAMRRCLFHATNSTNGTPLTDFFGLCLYGSTPGTLTPMQTTLDFGTVTVGQEQTRTLSIQHNGLVSQHVRRVYLQTGDIDGNFRFSAPCNPDASYCDENLSAQVDAAGMLSVIVKCTPQTPGAHSAQLYVGTDTFQLLASPVTLTCNGSAASAPVLGVNPSRVELVEPIEVVGDTAKTTVHLSNAGGAMLVLTDVRTVDVDTGAAIDWTYNASGACSGQITTMCILDPGETIDLELTFNPSAIGRRRATLLISYKDTVDRTTEIPLDGVGLGAKLRLAGGLSALSFGSVPLGRQSLLQIDLANTGNRDTAATIAVAAGSTPPFTVAPSPTAIVTPTALKTLTVTCAPTTAGSASTVVTADSSDAFMSPQISVNVTCEGSTLDLFSSPTSLMLGEVRNGVGTVTRTVMLLSDSGTPITLAGQPALETPNNNITIHPLASMTTPTSFDVEIDPPTTEGQLSAAIIVDATNGETLRIPLSGRVVKPSYIVADKVDLGTFCVGQPTTSSNISLVSDGTATLGLTAPTLAQTTSPFELSLTSPSMYPSTLPAAGTATLAITPHRQTSVTTVTDTLTWHTDAVGALTATTMLTARFTDSGGAIAPPALDFGKVTVHLFNDDGQRVVLQNCNDTPLTLDPPMIRTPFSIDSPNFPSVLDPNETIAFSVGFHPTKKGVVSDTLRISSPQLPDGPLEVMLVGEGQAPDMMMPDGGTGSESPPDTSFYACSCSSGTGHPGGGIPILLAVLAIVFPRRRRAG
ncbi:MAG TPA: choice-of-anchor D domain-containing protein [Kofleriaceae bacterium]|nr:choice-of-anchor D domain-containing protein [Kofleriaceae bacterium]